jgi:hypothetical protein
MRTRAIRDRRADLEAGEVELGQIERSTYPYPRWLGSPRPALLSMAVTVRFGGSPRDTLATFSIGLAIQPALERIERSDLTAFFQVVFDVSATALLVVLLVKIGLPLQGGLASPASVTSSDPGSSHDPLHGTAPRKALCRESDVPRPHSYLSTSSSIRSLTAAADSRRNGGSATCEISRIGPPRRPVNR